MLEVRITLLHKGSLFGFKRSDSKDSTLVFSLVLATCSLEIMKRVCSGDGMVLKSVTEEVSVEPVGTSSPNTDEVGFFHRALENVCVCVCVCVCALCCVLIFVYGKV